VPTQAAPILTDTLKLPASLDGSSGLNRAPGDPARLNARNDLEAVRAWAATYAQTPTSS
jgi:hypothetical protein